MPRITICCSLVVQSSVPQHFAAVQSPAVFVLRLACRTVATDSMSRTVKNIGFVQADRKPPTTPEEASAHSAVSRRARIIEGELPPLLLIYSHLDPEKGAKCERFASYFYDVADRLDRLV